MEPKRAKPRAVRESPTDEAPTVDIDEPIAIDSSTDTESDMRQVSDSEIDDPKRRKDDTDSELSRLTMPPTDREDRDCIRSETGRSLD